MANLGDDLRAFIDASPSPCHAVAEIARRLQAAGFSELEETDRWRLQPGGQHYVVRDGGSIVAFRVGSSPPQTRYMGLRKRFQEDVFPVDRPR